MDSLKVFLSFSKEETSSLSLAISSWSNLDSSSKASFCWSNFSIKSTLAWTLASYSFLKASYSSSMAFFWASKISYSFFSSSISDWDSSVLRLTSSLICSNSAKRCFNSLISSSFWAIWSFNSWTWPSSWTDLPLISWIWVSFSWSWAWTSCNCCSISWSFSVFWVNSCEREEAASSSFSFSFWRVSIWASFTFASSVKVSTAAFFCSRVSCKVFTEEAASSASFVKLVNWPFKSCISAWSCSTSAVEEALEATSDSVSLVTWFFKLSLSFSNSLIFLLSFLISTWRSATVFSCSSFNAMYSFSFKEIWNFNSERAVSWLRINVFFSFSFSDNCSFNFLSSFCVLLRLVSAFFNWELTISSLLFKSLISLANSLASLEVVSLASAWFVLDLASSSSFSNWKILFSNLALASS